MANAKVNICNTSLGLLGQQAIQSLDGNDNVSVKCKLFYQQVADEVLRSHDFRCARKRSSLARVNDNPAFGYAYRYQLPADCLCVRSMVGEELAGWEIEGRSLLTDNAECKIIYTKRIEDVREYDALLTEAIYTKLASKLAASLKLKSQTSDYFAAWYERVLKRALSINRTESSSPEEVLGGWHES